jgi:transposase-like protein
MPTPRKFTDEQEASIIAAVEAKEAICAIARRFGCAPRSVYDILYRHGIRQRPPSQRGTIRECNTCKAAKHTSEFHCGARRCKSCQKTYGADHRKARIESGRCESCGNPRGSDGTSTLCGPCRAKAGRRCKNSRLRKILHGLCPRCGKTFSGAGPICGRCLQRSRTDRRLHQCRRPDVRNPKERARARKLRAMVMEHYGAACACCGEDRLEFLSIDHINGNGKQHRAAAGGKLYRLIVKQGFPADLRILCYNCNCSLGFNGYCPHGNIDPVTRVLAGARSTA